MFKFLVSFFILTSSFIFSQENLDACEKCWDDVSIDICYEAELFDFLFDLESKGCEIVKISPHFEYWVVVYIEKDA